MLVVIGETGSGKTTQVSAGRDRRGESRGRHVGCSGVPLSLPPACISGHPAELISTINTAPSIPHADPTLSV